MDGRDKPTLSRATFGRSKRLLNAADYSRVFDSASARASHRYVLLLASPNDGNENRLGLVIAKKHVRKATMRNRVKRIAREVFRRQADNELPMDVIVLARAGIDGLGKKDLARLLDRQFQKLRVNTQ